MSLEPESEHGIGIYFTIAVFCALALPIIGAWLLTSNSPRQRAVGKVMDVAGKVAVLVVIVVAGVTWLVS